MAVSIGCGGGGGGGGGSTPTPVNQPPTFSNLEATISVAENQTSVVTVSASDPEGASLSYSLTGTDASMLSISSSGAIVFTTAPDYETKTSYAITVGVSDGTNSISRSVTINITNVNDISPVISDLASSVSVDENQTAVVTVSATDAEGDALTYTLTGTDASSLSISSSGVITFDPAPDYETKTSYAITVNVSDGTNTTSQDLTIAITNVNDSWTQRGLDIDGEAAGDDSGPVSISGDGNTVAIGAYNNDGSSGDVNFNSGHVRIYDWNGSAWEQRGLDIDGEAADDLSGFYVSMSNDGNTVAIGAIHNDRSEPSVYGTNGTGHVRIYDWNGSAWLQRGQDIDGEKLHDQSGYVSISGDGNTVAIGASLNDGDRNGYQIGGSGHVRIYDWNIIAWDQRGQDIDGEATGDGSGYVSMSNDGNVVAIGAPNNDGNGTSSGHVRIYDWRGSAWFQAGQDIDGGAANHLSGISVSMSNAGNMVAIGAVLNAGNIAPVNGGRSGHVRIYGWNGSAWLQAGQDIDGEAVGDSSWHVSISGDGNTVAIGAVGNDGNSGDVNFNSGHVRIYDWNGSAWTSAWTQRGQDIDGEAADDRSGGHVSISNDGNVVAIGAVLNDGNGDRSGHVRIYDWN